MKQKPILWSITGGLFVGFVAGLMAYPFFPSPVSAQEKKEKEEKTVVKQLEQIEQAISDRNGPVAKELRHIEGAISDRNHPVVKQLEDISKKLDTLSDIEREIQKVERHLD